MVELAGKKEEATVTPRLLLGSATSKDGVTYRDGEDLRFKEGGFSSLVWT